MEEKEANGKRKGTARIGAVPFKRVSVYASSETSAESAISTLIFFL